MTPTTYISKINSCTSSFDYDQALYYCNEALDVYPENRDILFERAGLLRKLRCFDASYADYQLLLAIKPNDALIEYNFSLAMLGNGDYINGWKYYERRWDSVLTKYRRSFPFPHWLSATDKNKKSVLVFAEQGFGDTFMFARYLNDFADLDFEIVLAVHPSQKDFFKGLNNKVHVVTNGDRIPQVTSYLPLMSLPYVLGLLTEKYKPEPITKLFTANQTSIETWASKLQKQPKKIGIAWRGDKNHQHNYFRSANLKDFLSLLKNTEYEIVSLSVDPTEEEFSIMQTNNIVDFSKQISSYSDTAAIISNLDKVISVDTSIIHLAASLGVPSHLLLGEIYDWRWGDGEVDERWYKSVFFHKKVRSQSWFDLIDKIELR